MMQTEIFRTRGFRRETLHIADDFEAAKAYAHANYRIAHMEDDADYEGCADAITALGDILTIQPVGFKL